MSVYHGDGDVTFKSCDNIIFKVHRKNLDTHSEGFGPPEKVTADPKGGVVSLPETAQVLELLFRYMYPMRQPDLKQAAFETLASLSEAVEKYQVFSAMEICKLYMEYVKPLTLILGLISKLCDTIRAATTIHPFEVLCYAAKHGYADLMNIAEEQATGMSLEDAYIGLTLEMYVAWVRSTSVCLGDSMLIAMVHVDSVSRALVGRSGLCPSCEKPSCRSRVGARRADVRVVEASICRDGLTPWRQPKVFEDIKRCFSASRCQTNSSARCCPGTSPCANE